MKKIFIIFSLFSKLMIIGKDEVLNGHVNATKINLTDSTDENIIDYFIPSSKYNTTYFSSPPDGNGEIVRRIRYQKVNNKQYILIDQRSCKRQLIYKIEYHISIEKEFILVNKISNKSFLTNRSRTFDLTKIPDTLMMFTSSEDEYWDRTDADGSMYECKVKPIKLLINGKEEKVLKLRMKEYIREGKYLGMSGGDILDLYYVKGIGLYKEEIIKQKYWDSNKGWVEDIYPFDEFRKLTYEN